MLEVGQGSPRDAPQKSWRKRVWTGKSGSLYSDCCLCDPILDKVEENGAFVEQTLIVQFTESDVVYEPYVSCIQTLHVSERYICFCLQSSKNRALLMNKYDTETENLPLTCSNM